MIVTLTLCYNNDQVLEKSIDRYYQLCHHKPDVHFLVDNEYPLNKEKYKETLKRLSHKYGCTILEPQKNLGMKNGSNCAINHLSLDDNDKIIFYDSNSYPNTQNFDDVLIKILDNENFGASCLTKENISLDILTDKYSGHNYYNDSLAKIRNFFGSSIGCFPFYIHKQIYFNIDLFSKNYGDIVNENNSMIKQLFNKLNKKIAFLSDYHELNNYFIFNRTEDENYSTYKFILASKLSFRDFSFEDYLINKNRYNRLSPLNHKILKINGLEF